MKNKKGFGLSVAIVMTVLSVQTSAYMLRPAEEVTEEATMSAPPGLAPQQVKMERRQQVRMAKERLRHARKVYKTAVRAHGKDSWQAKSALEWIGATQAELKMVQGLSTAAVAGGAGQTGGESVTGSGRSR